jgi:hypothetical protein
MNKIIEIDKEDIFGVDIASNLSRGNGWDACDGNSDGNSDCDGHTFGRGESFGSGRRISMVTSVVDAYCISPLMFSYAGGGRRIIDWDEAWKIATEEEKLILIQLMVLR